MNHLPPGLSTSGTLKISNLHLVKMTRAIGRKRGEGSGVPSVFSLSFLCLGIPPMRWGRITPLLASLQESWTLSPEKPRGPLYQILESCRARCYRAGWRQLGPTSEIPVSHLKLACVYLCLHVALCPSRGHGDSGWFVRRYPLCGPRTETRPSVTGL